MADEKDWAEVYSDLFTFRMSPYTAILEFGIRPLPQRGAAPAAPEDIGLPRAERAEPERAAVIRMSPEHAKVLAIVVRRHIQEYERQNGITIDVPQRILQELNIPPEDWRQFTG